MANAGTSLSLLERARNGDQQSWQRLVEIYGPLVERWCVAGGLRGEDVRDVAQEVFTAVVSGLDGFARRDLGAFRAWLRGVTRYKLFDHFRRGRQPSAAGGTDALQL